MTDEVTEVKEIIVEKTIETPETIDEVKAEIAIAKSEALVERAEESVALIEQAANIAVAQIAADAEKRIEEHEIKTENLEWNQSWAQERINHLELTMEKLINRVEELELKLSTPQTSEQMEMPPTVIVQNEDEGDQVAQQENPIIEPIQKVKRKIRAL